MAVGGILELRDAYLAYLMEKSMGMITDNNDNKVGEFEETLADWRQAAQVEAKLRREFQEKLETARFLLALCVESGVAVNLALRISKFLHD